MPVRPQTILLAQKVQIGMIQSANVVTRSKPTGSTHATTENAPIMASGAAVSPASGTGAPPQTISSGPSTPLASDPISSCTTRAQYLGFGFQSKYRDCEYRRQQRLMLYQQAMSAISCRNRLRILMWSSQMIGLDQVHLEVLRESTQTIDLHLHPPARALPFQQLQARSQLSGLFPKTLR